MVVLGPCVSELGEVLTVRVFILSTISRSLLIQHGYHFYMLCKLCRVRIFR
jgi:hypothetical protein